MRVSDEVLQRNSNQELSKDIHALSDAGAGVIHLRTNEIQRCLNSLRLACAVDLNPYKEWDIVNGWRTFDVQNRDSPNVTGDKKVNFVNEIRVPEEARNALFTPDLMHVDGEPHEDPVTEQPTQWFVFVNPQYWMENNPVFAHMIQHYANELPGTEIRVVLVTPDQPLPDTIADSVVTLRFNPPGHEELREYLDKILSDTILIELTEEEKDAICFAGAGMTQEAFEMYASISIVETNEAQQEEDEDADVDITADDIMRGVNVGKTAVVNKNDLLELYDGESMDDVGGLDLLKEWISKRKNCFTEEAAEFGISAPKGIVFVGPPGTGKSLAAKAVANEFGVPLIRLDFGKVFNSLVGSSEERIRTALRQVSYMAPCVLFVDEIDKGLGGIGQGGGDSGTSSRVLGTFLTWLNDNKAPVFTMVTANNINGLPPELMRRGRFDEIFASSLPDEIERREILDIHLRKRNWDIQELDDHQIGAVIKQCEGFSGAEIEAVVTEGLIDGFDAGCSRDDFEATYFFTAAKGLHPLSRAYKNEILAMTTWAAAHARRASIKRDDKPKQEATKAAKSRIRNQARRKRPAPKKENLH